jgi:hypothetical protein
VEQKWAGRVILRVATFKFVSQHKVLIVSGSFNSFLFAFLSLDTNIRMKPVVSVINVERISTTNLAFYETVILPNFVPSIDNYVQILTRMARHSIKGNFHSFLTKEDALIARPLMGILEQCGQAVPEALRNLHLTSSVPES